MMKYYDPTNNRIVFILEKATPDFWDRHWQINDLRSYIISCNSGDMFTSIVKRYLPIKSTILDGGCGRGQLVYALRSQGYVAFGVDFAVDTVRSINYAMPELDIRVGDIHSLDIGDGELDGYISAGVIEHFWEGYDAIISDMARTLRDGGYLFLSFPYISPLRKLKIILGIYPRLSSCDCRNGRSDFYQFALTAKQVRDDLERYGFHQVTSIKYDGIKGLKDEINFFKPLLQAIYDGKRGGRISRYILDRFLSIFTSHMMIFVMKKKVN